MEDVLVLARWARKHSEFYQKLYQGKRLRGVRDLPVVEKDDLVERGILDREIFTSSLAEKDKSESLADGADEFVIKPINIDAYSAELERILYTYLADC